MQNRGYANTREYLQDYFALLALRLHRQVHLTRLLRGQGQNEAFLGLFLSEQEIEGVLTELHGVSVACDDQVVNLEAAEEALVAQIQARLAHTSERLRPGRLADLFDLSAAMVEVLLLLLAPEVDNRFARVYAYLQDDVARRWLSPGVALRLLPEALPDDPAWRSLFSAGSPLLRHRLVHFEKTCDSAQTPLLDRALKLDDRITEYLLEHDPLDPLLIDLVTVETAPVLLDDLLLEPALRTQLDNLIALWAAPNASPAFFWGRPGSGKASAARALATALNRPLLTLDARLLSAHASAPMTEILLHAIREACLRNGILHVRCVDSLETGALIVLLRLLRAGMVLSARREIAFHDLTQPLLVLHFPVVNQSLRQRLWHSTLNGQPHLNGPLPAELSSHFRLTPGQIVQAVQSAQQRAWLRAGPTAPPQPDDLFEGCRQQSNPGLARLASKVVTPYGWDDLVLPDPQLALLHAIEAQVRHAHLVFQQWGFDRKLALGKGLTALFSGPPGTGKTMAAGILAQSLGVDLYKIDLSSVVSKYIGETEKNLAQIFDEASTANAILFFDEADALFGKRSEVKDAHDRYANIEISYLLQKMEEYEGVAILATNLSQNLDEAFSRRMQFVIEFPFPAAADRLRIWRGLFPAQAPCAADLDFDFLAGQFELAGGHIKNCVLAAAFLAAEDGAPIGMAHLIQGVVREYSKIGRPLTRSSFGEYYALARRRSVAPAPVNMRMASL